MNPSVEVDFPFDEQNEHRYFFCSVSVVVEMLPVGIRVVCNEFLQLSNIAC